jgi:hypothetical protein
MRLKLEKDVKGKRAFYGLQSSRPSHCDQPDLSHTTEPYLHLPAVIDRMVVHQTVTNRYHEKCYSRISLVLLSVDFSLLENSGTNFPLSWKSGVESGDDYPGQ